MSNWRKEPIGKLADTYSGGTPSRSREDYFKGKIPWISSGEVNLPYISDTKEKITQEAVENSSARWIPKYSVLVAMYGATAGVVSKLLIDATSNQAVLALIPKKELVDVDFLYHQVKENKQAILYLAQGSGQPNLSKDLIDKFEIRVPVSILEQKKIALILSTTDSVIEKTQAALTKYKAIKQGMLNDLYSRGIDIQTGMLRPKQEDAPELYKESELGWIPKAWEIGKLINYCNRISVGIATSSSNYFTDNGVLFIRNQNIKENRIDLFDKVFITKEFADINSSKYLKKGDVITVRTGYPGISAVVPKELEGSQTFTTLITSPNLNLLNSHYLSYFINSLSGKKQVLNLQGGGAQQNLNSHALETMLIPKPNLIEQDSIVLIMKKIEENIDAEQNYLLKLQQIKSGLMADLLSGEKLVTVPSEIATQTT